MAGNDLMIPGNDVPIAAVENATRDMVATREQTEIQGAIVIAKRFPRSEDAAFAKMRRAFQSANLANAAAYRFPRGGKEVSGKSVDLARECAKLWGNIRSGMRVVQMDDTYIHIKGFAFDMETNVYAEAEDKFKPLIQRKFDGQTKWIKPDERDLRELVNRHGAICERNAILKVLPSYFTDAAFDEATKTMSAAAHGELKQSRDATIRNLVSWYDEIGVNVQMLEAKLGHPLANINENELVELRKIGKSIVDGNSKREEHFDMPRPAEPEKDTLAGDLEKQLDKSKKASK